MMSKLNANLWLAALFWLSHWMASSRCVASDIPVDDTDNNHRLVVLIKMGGSSITNKAMPETLNNDALTWFANALTEAQQRHRNISFVIVHGAGSFGHHIAKEYGIQGTSTLESSQLSSMNRNVGKSDDATTSTKANETSPERRLLLGLGRTRLSVQKLNHIIVHALLQKDMPAVGISPCFGGVYGLPANGVVRGGSTNSSFVTTLQNKFRASIEQYVNAGLIPVIHGDAGFAVYEDDDDAETLDQQRVVGILSGDTIIELLGSSSWITHVVFITDVNGVYTADPTLHKDAILLPTLYVDPSTRQLIIPPMEEACNMNVTGSTHDHDVTGGLKTKLASAMSIVASSGKNVTIVRAETASAEQAIHTASATVATVIQPRIVDVCNSERYTSNENGSDNDDANTALQPPSSPQSLTKRSSWGLSLLPFFGSKTK